MHCWNIMCFCATFAIFQYVFIQPIEEMVSECTNGGLGASKRRQPNRAFKLNSYLYWINSVKVTGRNSSIALELVPLQPKLPSKRVFREEFWWKRNESRKFNVSKFKFQDAFQNRIQGEVERSRKQHCLRDLPLQSAFSIIRMAKWQSCWIRTRSLLVSIFKI